MTTRELHKNFIEVVKDYESKFGEEIVYPEGLQIPLEEWIMQLRRCIEANVPYKLPELPKDCII